MAKKFIEKAAEAPARMLERAVLDTEKLAGKMGGRKTLAAAKNYWHILGPGLTTGASDDDGSGIATYSQTGARYGYGLLWLAAFTFPLMAIVQEMCARIGLVTGQGLAANIKKHFPRWVLLTATMLLFTANTFNIGADIGAMAEAVRLFRPEWSFGLIAIGMTALILGLQIFTPYKNYAKYLKWLALVLLSYIFSTLLIDGLDWMAIGRAAIVPSLANIDRDQIILICAILGTTISPYLFFWQTSQEVEEEIASGETSIASRRNGLQPEQIKDMRVDVWSGMFLSNLVMFFIITATAATLNATGITNIETAAQAAEALRPLAGDYSYALFAIGIIGVCLLGIPVLAGSASYAISESFGWRQGLSYKLKQAYAFYGVIILSVLIGLGLNFVGLDPIKALIYSAVANGLVAPVVLALIVILSANKKIMGERVNHPITTWLGWITTAIMVTAGVATIWSFF
ncbi:MAG: divalent metal cation transporter [bacterium]|nr:divalent metal cation transporter [bacterium]